MSPQVRQPGPGLRTRAWLECLLEPFGSIGEAACWGRGGVWGEGAGMALAEGGACSSVSLRLRH